MQLLRPVGVLFQVANGGGGIGNTNFLGPLSIGIVLGYVLQSTTLRQEIITYVFQSFPALTGTVQTTIESFLQSNHARGSAGLIALVSLLWSGTGLYGGLAAALNAALWRLNRGPPSSR